MDEIQSAGQSKTANRELYSLYLDDFESMPGSIRLPSAHYVALLAADAAEADPKTIAEFAKKLLNSGCVFFCAWGPDCERVHDIFDEECYEIEPVILTTWHSRVTLGESVSMELHPLLQKTYVEFTKQPTDLHKIKASLENLLSFLTTSSGRTTANCFVTDLFFCLSSDWDEEVDWESFPDTLTDIIDDLGGVLHDTVDHPEIARNFDSLPEQLLERVKLWKPV